MTMQMTGDVSTDAMLKDLKTLVEIESPSRNLEALAVSAKAVADIIEKHLGGTAKLIDSDAGRRMFTGPEAANPRS